MTRGFKYAVCALLLVSVTGCKSQSLAGKWKSDLLPVEIEFKPGGDLVMTMKEPVTVNINGKWKQEGPRLTLSGMKIDGMLSSMPGADKLTQDQTVELSWKSDDQIILTGGGFISGAFTRVTE